MDGIRSASRTSARPRPRKQPGIEPTRTIAGFDYYDIPSGKDGFKQLMQQITASKKDDTRRIWREAARLGMMAAGPGGPLGAVLSQEALASLDEALDALRAKGVGLTSADGKPVTARGFVRAPRVAAKAAGMDSQAVESLADLQALDAFHVTKDFDSLRAPRLAEALDGMQRDGWTFRLGGTYVDIGVYGAWRWLSGPSNVPVEASRDRERRDISSARVAEAMAYFDGKREALEAQPFPQLAAELRDMEHLGSRRSAVEIWASLLDDPARSAPDGLSAAVRDGLRTRADFLEQHKNSLVLGCERRDQADIVEAGVMGIAGIGAQTWSFVERFAELEKSGGGGWLKRAVEDVRHAAENPPRGRTAVEAIEIFASLLKEMPPKDARAVLSRASRCEVAEQDAYFDAARRLGDAQALHGAWLQLYDSPQETAQLLKIADTQRELKAGPERASQALAGLRLATGSPLQGATDEQSVDVLCTMSSVLQPERGWSGVEKVYRRLAGQSNGAARANALVESYATHQDVNRALEAADRAGLEIVTSDDYIVIGGVRVPKRTDEAGQTFDAAH